MDGLDPLSDGYLLQGNYAGAVAQATRLLQIDPLREKTHRQLTRLLAWSGEREAALLVDQELLLPVEDVWTRTGLAERVNQDIRDVCTYGGQAYLLPFTRNVFIFYYNKHVFDDLNLAPPPGSRMPMPLFIGAGLAFVVVLFGAVLGLKKKRLR